MSLNKLTDSTNVKSYINIGAKSINVDQLTVNQLVPALTVDQLSCYRVEALEYVKLPAIADRVLVTDENGVMQPTPYIAPLVPVYATVLNSSQPATIVPFVVDMPTDILLEGVTRTTSENLVLNSPGKYNFSFYSTVVVSDVLAVQFAFSIFINGVKQNRLSITKYVEAVVPVTDVSFSGCLDITSGAIITIQTEGAGVLSLLNSNFSVSKIAN